MKKNKQKIIGCLLLSLIIGMYAFHIGKSQESLFVFVDSEGTISDFDFDESTYITSYYISDSETQFAFSYNWSGSDMEMYQINVFATNETNSILYIVMWSQKSTEVILIGSYIQYFDRETNVTTQIDYLGFEISEGFGILSLNFTEMEITFVTFNVVPVSVNPIHEGGIPQFVLTISQLVLYKYSEIDAYKQFWFNFSAENEVAAEFNDNVTNMIAEIHELEDKENDEVDEEKVYGINFTRMLVIIFIIAIAYLAFNLIIKRK